MCIGCDFQYPPHILLNDLLARLTSLENLISQHIARPILGLWEEHV